MALKIKKWHEQYLIDHANKYTIEELSEHLNLAYSTLYNHLRARKLKPYKKIFRMGTVVLPPVEEYIELFPDRKRKAHGTVLR